MIEQKKIYNSFSSYLKERYGEKVRKIMVNAGFTCPNRDGTKGTGGCTFCNEKGSGNSIYNLSDNLLNSAIQNDKSYKISRGPLRLPYKNGMNYKKKSGYANNRVSDYKILSFIQNQVTSQIERLTKNNIHKYMLYFQSFTNTYASVDILKARYDAGLIDDRIVALAIGTRPDCVDEHKIKLIQSYTNKYDVWIEYGLQSIHQRSLKRINRQHTVDDFMKAINITKNKNIKICVHIIVGLPNESYEDIMETAKFVAQLPIDAIKIHSLYIEKGTQLYSEFKNKPFRIFTKEEYIKIVCDILEILPKNIIIQRLTGDPSEDFVAPEWIKDKTEILNSIQNELKTRHSYQGSKNKNNFL